MGTIQTQRDEHGIEGRGQRYDDRAYRLFRETQGRNGTDDEVEAWLDAEDSTRAYISNATCEFAVLKALGLDKFGLPRRKSHAGFVVRRVTADIGGLPIYEGDEPDLPIALVWDESPRYLFMGWAYPRDARDGFVPKKELKPALTLKPLVRVSDLETPLV